MKPGRKANLPATLLDLPTPSAVIDLDRLKNNTERMVSRAHALGVRLRPHVKTHKCIEAARYQIGDHFGGITVSTLAEAAYFAAHQFTDITYGVPIAPGRMAQAAEVAQMGTHLNLLMDDLGMVDPLSKQAILSGVTFNVLVKVDCGYHRAGLLPDDPQLVSLAKAINQAPGLVFDGILTHAGNAYDCTSVDAIKGIAEEERRQAVYAADILRQSGLSVSTVSVGSTPTTSVVEDLTGVTEVRPGNYALFDVFQSAIGSCTRSDVALSVITEVIGRYPARDTLLVDAGALAMSKDPGAVHVSAEQDFGVVCHPISQQAILGLRLVSLSQEHGKVVMDSTTSGPVAVGDKLRILPNHSCLVTALYPTIYVVQGTQVVDQWRPARGW